MKLQPICSTQASPLASLTIFVGLLMVLLPPAPAGTPGTFKWLHRPAGPISGAAAVMADGTVIMATEVPDVIPVPVGSGAVVCAVTDIGTGASIKWTFVAGTEKGVDDFVAAPALNQEQTRVYIGSLNGRLYSLNAVTGALLWSTIPSSPIRTTAAVARHNGETRIYVAAGSSLRAFRDNGSSVTTLWTAPVDPVGAAPGLKAASSPVVGADGTVYLATFWGQLHAIKPDGLSRWPAPDSTLALPAQVAASPAIGPQGWLYVTTYDSAAHAFGYLTAINPAADAPYRKVWETEIGPSKTTPAVAQNGRLVVGNDLGDLKAVEPVAGQILWTTNIVSYSGSPGQLLCSSPTLTADGRIQIADTGGTFYSVRPDGKIAWTWTTNGIGPIHATAAVACDGTLYFGDTYGTFFALHASSRLMSSAWPSLGRGMRRSGDQQNNPWSDLSDCGGAVVIQLYPFSYYYDPGIGCFAYELNSYLSVAGQSSGYYYRGNGDQRAARWDSGLITFAGYGVTTLYTETASAINDLGTVVGHYLSADYSTQTPWYRFPAAPAVSLPTLPGWGGGWTPLAVNSPDYSIPGGLAAQEFVVGWAYNGSYVQRAVRWNIATGIAQDLLSLGGVSPAIPSFAFSVNRAGQVVGQSKTTSTSSYKAFKTASPTATIFDGSTLNLGTLSGNPAHTSVARDSSNTGWMCGSSTQNNGQTRAWVLPPGATALATTDDIGTLGGTFSDAYSINDLGHAVGMARNGAGVLRPFLYIPGLGMTDLSVHFSGWTSLAVEAINNQGLIVGSGQQGGLYRGWVLYAKP
jgi:probable HAF family extracellular repeat protein